jgi:hypothetical protein
MDLRELREVYAQNKQMHKILFQFIQICCYSRDTEP